MNDIAISARSLGKCFAIYDKTYYPLLNLMFRGRRSYHREFWALRDVSFDVRKGETVGIIGRNGSGKSTLLQLICGTLAPSVGDVETRGRIAALLELGSGFNPEFTGRENVFLNGAILGVSRQEMADRFDEIAAFAEIGDFIDQPVKTYSSGMFVRLAFATAIHTSPDLLIVDEALAVGDAAFQARCLERIRAMQESGVSILLVTHSMNAIIEYCDRAIYLDKGRMVFDGACRDAVDLYSADIVREEGGVALAAEPRSESEAVAMDVQRPASEIVETYIADADGQPQGVMPTGAAMRVVLRVLYRVDIAEPCFGIQVKSQEDIVLWSATTQMLDLAMESAHAGEVHEYAWSLRIPLGAGRYVVALGVGELRAGVYKRHYRMHYATHFEVVGDGAKRGVGWLAPDVGLTRA
jgi:lipopolysaccharide transport system ATP-binding protein